MEEKLFDQIYKIYTLLHRSEFKNSDNFRQFFSHFWTFMFKMLLTVCKCCPKLTYLDEFFRNFSNSKFYYFSQKMTIWVS